MKILLYILLIPLTFSPTSLEHEVRIQFYGNTEDNCAENKPLDRSLLWYGVFNTNSGEFVRKINSNFLDSIEKKKSIDIIGKSANNEKLLFYIGMSKPLKEKQVSFLGDWYGNPHTLYPGERHTLYTKGNSLDLYSTGNVVDYTYCPIIEKYGVKIISSVGDYQTRSRQELYKYFENKGECGLVSLFWFGELDNDGKVDFILETSSNSGKESALFLSSIAGNDGYVKFAGNFRYGNCY